MLEGIPGTQAPATQSETGRCIVMFDWLDRRTGLLIAILIFFNVLIFGCFLLLLTGKMVI